MKILVVNVGSTSLKFKLFSFSGDTYLPEDMIVEGKIEGIGQPESVYKFSAFGEIREEGKGTFEDYGKGIQAIIRFLTSGEHGILGSLNDLTAVAFKTVHGGSVPEGAVLLAEDVLTKMEEFSLVAPAHNPPYIRAIKTFKELMPSKPMVGLFEPTFHKSKPPEAVFYGLPLEIQKEMGIQGYGFHGASLRYVSERVSTMFSEKARDLRLIACHLGGSSSICAIKNGRSLDTSMGFSPQTGIIHSSRPGDLDPFVVLYLMKKKGWSIEETVDFLCKKSGLNGLSGLGTGEFKCIEKEALQGNERAMLAVDIFIYGIAKYIGAYTAVLEGADVLVFTGGIGEHSSYVRERICKKFRWLGIEIDNDKNIHADGKEIVISKADSRITVIVIPTNEEFIVAKESARLLKSS